MPLIGNRETIIEILRSHPEQARRLWVEEGYQQTFSKVVDEAKLAGVAFRVISHEEFSRRFKTLKARLCLESEEFAYADPDELLARLPSVRNPFLAAFDAVNDPQNLGNIMRSAACLGTGALILPKDRSCSVNETAIRVASGASAHVKVARVTNIVRYMEELKKARLFCYGLDQRGRRTVAEADLTGPICLVLGSEEGLRRLTRERCDEVLRIPTNPDFPALNVATSFAIAAYEVMRQRNS